MDEAGHQHAPDSSTRHTAKDPVCGMTVDVERPKGGAYSFAGVTYYFCNPRCNEKFRSAPEKYLNPAARDEASAGTAASYTCPMHPEIVRDAPGACPICGMALEPRDVTAADEVNPELVDMTRRFWISLALTAPVFVLSMAEMIPGQPVQHAIGASLATWIQFALATPVVLWGGRPFFERGWASIVNRHLNMFTLIAIGVGAAYFYSAIVMLLPRLFPPSFSEHGMVGVVPRVVSDARRSRRGLLRSRGGDHGARVARASARAAGAQSDEQRHPRLAAAGAEHGAARAR